MKVRKDDTVQIMTGKDKGKKGKVLRAFPDTSRVIVEGIRIVKKHVKRDKVASGILEVAKSIAVSSVMVMCPSCNKPSRMGYKDDDGQKKRFCKSCKKVITNK